MGYGIFALTMLCVYMRPFRLPIWVFSTLGALCVFVFGVVSLADITLVWEITKPSTLALIGLILLSLAFEKLGFFTHLASCITPRTHSIRTWKFFVLLIVLGSLTVCGFFTLHMQVFCLNSLNLKIYFKPALKSINLFL